MIDIKEKDRCCGCTACFNICPKHCISMEKDAEGFTYPIANEQECIRCGLCEKVCPMLNSKEAQGETKAYAVYALEEEIRRKSTSGGVFTVLADNILRKGGFVFGCAYNPEFVAEHILVTEYSDLEKLQGSKYVQSDLKDCFVRIKELLEAGKEVLFSGTTCQVEGLKRFLQKSYDTLFLIDIVCHGVPSPMIWERYKELQEKQYGSSIADISLRNKDFGWQNYKVKITFKDGQIYTSKNWDDIYLRSYLKGLVSRPSCYECPFRQWNRGTDITLGDFWGIEQVFPEWNDNKGISLVLVHSEKGYKMMQNISGLIESRMVSEEVAIRQNPSIVKSEEIPADRAKFWNLLIRKGYFKAVRKYVQGGLSGEIKKVMRKFINGGV